MASKPMIPNLVHNYSSMHLNNNGIYFPLKIDKYIFLLTFLTYELPQTQAPISSKKGRI